MIKVIMASNKGNMLHRVKHFNNKHISISQTKDKSMRHISSQVAGKIGNID